MPSLLRYPSFNMGPEETQQVFTLLVSEVVLLRQEVDDLKVQLTKVPTKLEDS